VYPAETVGRIWIPFSISTLVGTSNVVNKVSTPRRNQTASENMPYQIAAKLSVLCCHLANTNEKTNFALYRITLIVVYFAMVNNGKKFPFTKNSSSCYR